MCAQRLRKDLRCLRREEKQKDLTFACMCGIICIALLVEEALAVPYFSGRLKSKRRMQVAFGRVRHKKEIEWVGFILLPAYLINYAKTIHK